MEDDEPIVDNAAKKVFKVDDVKVKVAGVQEGLFDLEILSNGKSYAKTSADIRFPMSKLITQVLIQNGDRVKKGQVLARLDDTDLKSKLERARQTLNKATAELDDRLIDYGFRLKDSAKVTKDIMRMAKIKSSYNEARYDYDDAAASLAKANIVAPFSGKIANVDARLYNNSDDYRKLCTLLDDNIMQVEFDVLETEYHFVNKGSSLDIVSFEGNALLHGTVTQVNPFIDANGMIRITGTVANSGGVLLNGASVKIVAKRPLQKAVYVPKEAVLQRNARYIAFVYENGFAKWNYVTTGAQNSKYIVITSGLKKGQKVIISNNINLANDSKVVLD